MGELDHSNSINERYIKNKIVFISDLHLDIDPFLRGGYHRGAMHDMSMFIDMVKAKYDDSILCIAGDIFNDYRYTLHFVKSLEMAGVNGFFVLGNHDYWNTGDLSYDDIISLFSTETENNIHFKFLCTGRKYYVDDLCVIGDTGWSSFRRTSLSGDTIDVDLSIFENFPEKCTVRNFTPTEVKSKHDKWISFANDIIATHDNLLIMTHWPMIDLTKGDDKDCWWSSTTELKDGTYWAIFGHTHKSPYHETQHVSNQIGYDHIDFRSRAFGILERVDERSISIRRENPHINLVPYYDSTTTLTVDAEIKPMFVKKVERRGFRRVSANMRVLSSYVQDREGYLRKVKRSIAGFNKTRYGEYVYVPFLNNSLVDALNSAVDVLERLDLSDVRVFMTSLVLTGYVYNGVPFLILDMRPLDEYDVLRFWFTFITILELDLFNIIDSRSQIRRVQNTFVEYKGIKVYIPTIWGNRISRKQMEYHYSELFKNNQMSDDSILLSTDINVSIDE